MLRLHRMAVRGVRVVCGLLVVSGFMVLGGLAMMMGGLFVMLGSLVVIIGAVMCRHGYGLPWALRTCDLALPCEQKLNEPCDRRVTAPLVFHLRSRHAGLTQNVPVKSGA